MLNNCFDVATLPDIEMYGGDTIPWEITLVRPNGKLFSINLNEQYTATVTLMPFKITSGLGNNATPPPPILTKTGEVKRSSDGTSTVVFYYLESDTKNLRGKFIYQVEIRCKDDLRIGQGCLYIKQNINR